MVHMYQALSLETDLNAAKALAFSFPRLREGVMRLEGISDLASRYIAATPAQQPALLQATLALMEIIGAHFVAGDFLAGAGWLLVSSVAFRLPAFPRWLAGLSWRARFLSCKASPAR